MDDRDVAHDLAHGPGDRAHAHVLVANEVEDPVRAGRRERGDDALGQVLDVDEAARLRPVAGDRQRLAAKGFVREGRHDRRRPRARAVGDAEAEDRVLDVVQLAVARRVHLAGDLRRRVEVLRQAERRVLVDDGRAGRVAVHPDRAREDEAAAAVVAHGLEQRLRAADVHEVGAGRLAGDEVDVGDRGEMQEGVAALDRGAHVLVDAEVAQHEVDVARRSVGRRHQVEDAGLVPVGLEPVDDVGADEAGAAGDEDLHPASPGR